MFYVFLISGISVYIGLGTVLANRWASPLYNYFAVKGNLQPGTDRFTVYLTCSLIWPWVLFALYLDPDGVGIRQGDYD